MTCGLYHVSAQEIKCTVTINSDQIEGSNKSVYNTLKQSIEEFVNNTKWTDLTFQERERIECNMMLIVKAVQDDMFICDFICQSRRPVYGTSYTTPLLNFQDNTFCFRYQEYDRLDNQQHTFTTNLTALLAYYCNLIIGYDMDSFARLGGTPYFQACENIVSAAQSASLEESEAKGWKAFDDGKNRYGIINDYLDSGMSPFREMQYKYYREGLDVMADNPDRGRAGITAAIDLMKEARQNKPMTLLPQLFTEYKRDELVNIYKGKGTAKEKEEICDILMTINPSQSSFWNQLKQ